jgi:fibronectin-binding autotransporter adhesin
MMCALASASALGATVGVGETLDVTSSTISLGVLHMEGGTLRLIAPLNSPLHVSTTNAVLGGGQIYNAFTQTGLTTFTLNGTTQVPSLVNGTSPAPANGMYLFGDPFDSTGLDVIHKGILNQTGSGELTLRGRVRFVNEAGALFSIQNDKGVRLFPSSEGTFLNLGTLRKSGNFGLSNIDTPFSQEGGTVELAAGHLWFNRGSTHALDVRTNTLAVLDADSAGTGHGGVIGFRMINDFKGVTTRAGKFEMSFGSSINVAAGTLWQQQGDFTAIGSITIGAAATLQNSGRLTAQEPMQGSGVLRNEAGGTFTGNIAPRRNPAPELIDVSNNGEFIVGSAHTVVVHDFDNHAGTLRVDGNLGATAGGHLSLLNGELLGTGIINAETFVGGGPGEARFRPGISPGTMTINGNFSLLPGGVLELEADVVSGMVQLDRLVVSGNIVLNGRIEFLVGPNVDAADVVGRSFFQCASFVCPITYGSEFEVSFPGGETRLLL